MCFFLKTNDVINAFNKLKSGKRDGTLGLCTAPHVSMLFSAMLIHDVASEDMQALYCCKPTLIPIPKGKNTNATDSSNYRGIALSSVFGTVFNLIF